MPRPQFSIRTLLWLTLVVAAFLGGMATMIRRAQRAEFLLIDEKERNDSLREYLHYTVDELLDLREKYHVKPREYPRRKNSGAEGKPSPAPRP